MKTAGTFFLKRDDLRLGLVLGLITPMILFAVIYWFRFGSSYTLSEFLSLVRHNKSLITFFGAWSIVGNVALFTAYINTRRDRTARGVFIITLVYGIGVLLAKAVL